VWRRIVDTIAVGASRSSVVLGMLASIVLLTAGLDEPGRAKASRGPSRRSVPSHDNGPGSASLARAHHSSDASLHIFVDALPRSVPAQLILSGPRGFRKHLSRSSNIKVPAGTYTLSAAPSRSSAGTYYATMSRVRRRVVAGRSESIAVSYATLVPNKTKVVPPSATVSLTGEPAGPRSLTLTGAAARGAKVGAFLASRSVPSAPDGYLVKVTRVTHRSDGTAILNVQNATLLEALPSGEIASERALEASAQAASLDTFAPREHGSSRAHTAGFSLQATNLTCDSSAGVHVAQPTVTFSPSIALHAHWGFFKLDSASFTATVAASLTMGASADAGAHCQTKDPGIGLLAHPVALPDIDVQAGPIPIVITPKLQVYLSGDASITAKVSVSLEQSASATVGVRYEHGRFSPIASFPEHFKQSFTPEGNADAELALTPTVDTLIYGVSGPSFDIGTAAKFDADIQKSPWWTLQGCLRAGLGFVIDPLDIDWSDPHLIQSCKTLLSATSAAPSSGGVRSGGTLAPPSGGLPAAGWNLQAVPGSSSVDSGLVGVSCTSSVWCLAVGRNEESTLTEIWSGSGWSFQATPNVGGLDNVSCVSTSWCMAIASNAAAVWTGSSWQTVAVPPVAGALSSQLRGISCVSPTACMAVGQAVYEGEESTPISELWNGTNWSLLFTPTPGGSYDTYLESVSCNSADSCMAVGGYDSPDNVVASGQAFAARWSGSEWTVQTVPNPAAAVWSGLSGVSCPSTTSCVAVGFDNGGAGTSSVPLAEEWNGGSWASTDAIEPSGTEWANGTQVSCASATSCEAVGLSIQGGIGTTLAEAWNGSSWIRQSIPNPPGATYSYLSGVACPTTTMCFATGSASLPGGADAAFAESYGG
jgi:hypothetical protein